MPSPGKTLASLLLPLIAGAACSTSSGGRDPGLEGLDVNSIEPQLAVPGTTFSIEGRSFVDDQWGTTRVVLKGQFDDGSGSREVEVSAPATFVDFDELSVEVTATLIADLGGSSGEFDGEVFIEVDSTVDDQTYRSRKLTQTLEFRDVLTPSVVSVDSDQLIFVNDKIVVAGDGFLLGPSEGETVAALSGCFIDPSVSGDCVDVSGTEIALVPDSRFDRTKATFAFHPKIAGIKPGTFQGEVTVQNRQPSGNSSSAATIVNYDLTEATVFQVSPLEVSLGQFTDIVGGGFLGGEEGGLTLVELNGSFTPTGASESAPVDIVLIPEFIEGRKVRYVMNEDDALGQSIDLRRTTGTFTGTLTPVTSYESVTVRGDSAAFNLGIAPVKQVVYLNFRPAYVESLRHFGLRALDSRIRQRIADVVARDYATINLEVRLEKPDDFSLFSEVEISGPDPNGLGLLGYDNTPGKDTENKRLFDRIGGVNAQTQEDGFPGFGGVFIESLFAFSEHPGDYANSIAGADGTFDSIFDSFRPDRDGRTINGADLAGGAVTNLTSGDECLAASAREDKIACAVWVLGSLIGTTLSHEIGHSLGLANPFGEGFHNSSDEDNRLMDSGGDRPFAERAELEGLGPARFCTGEYDYLRQILPTTEAMDTSDRPSCF